MEKIIILDSGSQYTQLIARRIREHNVYCEILPYFKDFTLDSSVKGIILSGSPFSVRNQDCPQLPLENFLGKVPVLAICYGAQYIAQKCGGSVTSSNTREYGRAKLTVSDSTHPLFSQVSKTTQVWMSHSDTVATLPIDGRRIASTEDVENAAYAIDKQRLTALQFHPEVFHTTEGSTMLKNFVFSICGCSGSWTSASFIEETVAALKQQIGEDKVILGLSGGVDSSVAALLLHRAIGKQLYCIFVDNGLLRKNEFETVIDSYKHLGLQVKGVDAKEEFWSALKNISDPEQKRKVIGGKFIEVFDREAHTLKDVKWLAQGTIYPDVIESVSVNGPSATIKSHHNVGGLPDKMKLKVVEPLRLLFKDEVRKVGRVLELPSWLLDRHPFPGPGLGIRILGEVSAEKIAILQNADYIFIESLRKHNLYADVWQAATILLPVKSVGVMGDERTYEYTIALRAVTSTDGMTADWAELPYSFLSSVSNEIINNVRGVNRVVYDISSKPPATIEWE